MSCFCCYKILFSFKPFKDVNCFWKWNSYLPIIELIFIQCGRWQHLQPQNARITFLISTQPCKTEKCNIWHLLPFCDTIACSYTESNAKTDFGWPFFAEVKIHEVELPKLTQMLLPTPMEAVIWFSYNGRPCRVKTSIITSRSYLPV